MQLTDPITAAPLVGAKFRSLFANLDIYSINDLLHHYPWRHIDYSQLAPITKLPFDTEVTVQGTVDNIYVRRTHRGLTIITAQVSDNTGQLEAVWFNQNFIAQNLKVGDLVNLSGKLSSGRLFPQMNSPEWEVVRGGEAVHTARIIPVYHETKGISSKRIRGILTRVMAHPEYQVEEYLPPEVLKANNLLGLAEALTKIHFPTSQADIDQARSRLAFDELLIIQLQGQLRRQTWKEAGPAHTISHNDGVITEFINKLPFPLTNAQQQCVHELVSDLAKSTPMNRLLEGDVGSGKTAVAAVAMYALKRSDLFVVLMAPTEVLAEQHFKTIKEYFKDFPEITIALHTGSTKSKQEKADILIGTHALLYEGIQFGEVGLVIIDEQHRFGVKQRAKLIQKASRTHKPHVLSMTATPIPRTIALTLYGDLDVSILNELPPGRTPVQTQVVPPEKRLAGQEWVRARIAQDNAQLFVICPLIEGERTDNLNDQEELNLVNPEEGCAETYQAVKAAKNEYERLKKVYPEFKLGLLHGQLAAKVKRAVLHDFATGNTQILVSTSVVEVGIDIPKANLMIIEGAERFGLAQLHQLRGRVGRGATKSYCFLFTETNSQAARQRLQALEKINDGFNLAEIDLQQRGPGEVWGLKQSGLPQLKIATLGDTTLLQQTKKAAAQLLTQDWSGNSQLKKLMGTDSILN